VNICRLTERRPGLFQAHPPIFLADGDAVNVFVEATADPDAFRVTDLAHTIQRIASDREVSTDTVAAVRVFAERHGFTVEGGEICARATEDELLDATTRLAEVQADIETELLGRTGTLDFSDPALPNADAVAWLRELRESRE
jgi:hypothetical protein